MRGGDLIVAPIHGAAAKAHLVFPFALPLAGLALMRMCPPSIFSTSNAPVFRTRSLSLLWP